MCASRRDFVLFYVIELGYVASMILCVILLQFKLVGRALCWKIPFFCV